jgi:DICT domain-containing protein
VPDPHGVRLLTKSTLVTVSHAIERAALAAAEDGPMVVMALFQRLPYFERERRVYERIARSASAVVVGVVGGETPTVLDGPHVVPLGEREDLAREWAVVVLTPRFGAVLVARDREQVDEAAATLEAGRLFDGWWTLRRDDALHEVIRLRGVLADRMPEAERAAVDDVVARVREVPAGAGESRSDAVMGLLVEQVDRDRARLSALRRQSAAPPDRSALTGEDEVRRWSGASGVTASGTLPVALLGVRVPPARQLPEQAGRRSGALRNEGLITVLNGLLRGSDRATRLGDDEFLLMLPALPHDDAVKLAYRVGAELTAAGGHNPFLPESATVVVTVTRRRPFPTERIREALDWAMREGVPVATVNEQI